MNGQRSAPGRRVPALCVGALLAISACRIGSGVDPSSSPVATSPHGTLMRIDWREDNGQFWGDRAELLAVSDSGLYLLHAGTVVFYPRGVDAVLRPIQAEGIGNLHLRSVSDLMLDSVAIYARYPFGLSPDQIDELLTVLHSDSVIVRRAP